MRFLRKIEFNDGMDQYRKTPEEIYQECKAKGADAIYAFQVRNPLHGGHVFLLQDAREQLIAKGYKNPVLVLHPCGGWSKDDDIPLGFRMRQHQILLDEGTLDPQTTVLAIWPSPMYLAGPTEVVWHAYSRVNCGVTHFITGRDPAGITHPEERDAKEVKTPLYDPWHGQKLLVLLQARLNIEIIPFKVAALNKQTRKMEFMDPNKDPNSYDNLSGSRVKTLA